MIKVPLKKPAGKPNSLSSKKPLAQRLYSLSPDDLPKSSGKAIRTLMKQRAGRYKNVSRAATASIVYSPLALIAAKKYYEAGNHLQAIAVALASLIPPVMSIAEHAANAKQVREATHLTGKALGDEARKNSKLRDFLEFNRLMRNDYVLINRKGEIVATNKERKFRIGRLRLEIKKNLNREY